MLKSMTAFGRAKREGEDKDYTVEIKSVNSRYFDCTVKLPKSYIFLEEKIKAHVQKYAVSRAKVDVYLTVDSHSGDTSEIRLNAAYAEKYIEALRELRDKFSLADDISVMTVARNSEVFSSERAEQDMTLEWERVRAVLDEAIASYNAMRDAEGERIERDVRAKVEGIKAYVSEVERISKEDIVGYRDKLEERIRKILADNEITPDESRLLTECALFADKIAIDEELVRLDSHFEAFYEMVASDTPIGRKLDFLIQEMNRETNTIGSKANNAKIARLVVDMKGEIEKIREQIQNIE